LLATGPGQLRTVGTGPGLDLRVREGIEPVADNQYFL
jgi:hypothetical protein